MILRACVEELVVADDRGSETALEKDA